MATIPRVAPVLSTPDTHIFEAPTSSATARSTCTDSELETTYEIQRTISEIQRNRWKRIALQFPDHLLPDAPRVYQRLREGLKFSPPEPTESLATQASSLSIDESRSSDEPKDFTPKVPESNQVTLSILADTSYGACCVDEVAAQHVSADVVIHYGRACLSPTSKLPAVHIFTVSPLPPDPVISAFSSTYPDPSTKIILTADIPYTAHLPSLTSALEARGYTSLFPTTTTHSPSSPIPNRTTPTTDPTALRDWSMFHIGEPPQALLLTLSSRISSLWIYPSTPLAPSPAGPYLASTSLPLRRRYALLTRLSRAPIIGILVNTLSVHAYMAALERIQGLISAAGKKYYVFAVGKLNPAKIANFAEVDGWVVVGCWESSLVESSEFEKPVVVPWELELALKSDEERVWTGEWRGDFDDLLRRGEDGDGGDGSGGDAGVEAGDGVQDGDGDFDSEEESEPPEFDLRTGRYIQHSRPMRQKRVSSKKSETNGSGTNGKKAEHSLIQRAKGDLARIGGEVSPGAEFLREKRTWRGLGSDFEIAYEHDDGPIIKEGRSGIARGYQNEEDKA